jgi:serine protease Do
MGTGVIIDPRGFILTNQHVVDGVQDIEAHLADGAIYPAHVVQQDPATDLAILKVNAGQPLPAVAIGSSADLMVGETVITIGNAFGYENTTSVGIISALGRNVRLSDDQEYRNLIQTDACINPGNSGGPLINIDGELIGINVAVRAGAQGIGFALPIDDVKRVATELMSTRRLASTWHGLVSGEVFQGLDRVVVLRDIRSGSPAELAGFQKGDEIVKVNGVDVTCPLDIERGLLDVRPGQQAQVVIHRHGEEKHLPLEPAPLNRAAAASLASQAGSPSPNVVHQVSDAAAADQVWRLLGLKTIAVDRSYVKNVSPSFRGGLYVEAVQPGSPADSARIQKGDILVGLNDGSRNWETIRADNILYILKLPEIAQGSHSLLYYLVRHNEFVQGQLSLNTEPTSVRR